MKKFLAAVMAAAMVVSMTAVASFAAPEVKAVKAKIVIDFTNAALTADATSTQFAISVANLTTPGSPIAIAEASASVAADIEALATRVGGLSVSGFDGAVDGLVVTFTQDPTATTLDLDAVTFTTVTNVKTNPTVTVTDGVTAVAATGIDKGAVVELGIAGPYVESAGDMVKGIVKPDKTLYFTLDATHGQKYAAHGDIKMTLTKGDNAKNIESVKLVEKKFDKTMVGVNGVLPATPIIRNYFIAVKLKDNMKDSEYKVNFDIKVTAKKDIAAGAIYAGSPAMSSGDTNTVGGYGTAWVNNYVDAGDDLTYKAGTGGVMSKPVKDDANTVTWEDEIRTLAKIVFTADSAVTVYYPKLSTAWDNEFYGMHFATDAYKFEFVGNPTISATARPVLSLMNPFIVDDEYTADVADLTVYRLVDGELVDATGEFTATTDDDGNQVLVTKTRTLGTYIVTDAEAVMTAAEEEVVAPEKLVPNTGR